MSPPPIFEARGSAPARVWLSVEGRIVEGDRKAGLQLYTWNTKVSAAFYGDTEERWKVLDRDSGAERERRPRPPGGDRHRMSQTPPPSVSSGSC